MTLATFYHKMDHCMAPSCDGRLIQHPFSIIWSPCRWRRLHGWSAANRSSDTHQQVDCLPICIVSCPREMGGWGHTLRTPTVCLYIMGLASRVSAITVKSTVISVLNSPNSIAPADRVRSVALEVCICPYVRTGSTTANNITQRLKLDTAHGLGPETPVAGGSLRGGKKSVAEWQFCKKIVCSSHFQPWLVAIGGWRLVALALGGWRLAVVGGWWWLAAGGGW